MANFAVIEDNFVLNLITGDNKEDMELFTGKTCVEYTSELIEIGFAYDPDTNKFAPVSPKEGHVWDAELESWTAVDI
jgi:hypothetical protein